MKITGDIQLRGKIWDDLRMELIEKHLIFKRAVDYFVIACAIGIAADEMVESDGEVTLTIARDTYQVNSDLSDIFDFMLKNALIASKKIGLDPETRLNMAFDVDYVDDKISPIPFLVKFANYGAQKILEIVSEHDLKTSDDLLTLVRNYIEDNYKDGKDHIIFD